MKFKIDRSPFIEMLRMVSKAQKPGMSIPILGSVLLEAGKDGLKVSATDMEGFCTASLPATVDVQGSIVVSSAFLSALLPRISDDLVSLELKKGGLQISSKSGSFRASVQDAKDFPQNIQIGEATRIEFEPGVLAYGLDRAAFLSKADRQELQMACLTTAKDSVTIASTDGKRIVKIELPATCGAGKSFMIGAKQIGLIQDLAGSNSSTLLVGERALCMEAGEFKVTCRLFDGTVPDFNRAIPGDSDRSFTCNREELKEAAQRSFIVSDFDHPKKMRLKLVKDRLTIETPLKGSDVLGGSETIEASGTDGMSFTITSNYLMLAMEKLEGKTIQLNQADDVSPIKIKSEDSPALHVIMPIRTV